MKITAANCYEANIRDQRKERKYGKHARHPIALQQAQGIVEDPGDPIEFRKVEIRPR